MKKALSSHKVFLDSSGFLALININDVYHKQAQDIWNLIIEEKWKTYTTNFVIAETHALFIIRLGHKHATKFLYQIRQSNTNILRINIQDEEKADNIIFHYDDKIFSYTDATSFAVMQRINIQYAFTFDRNFTQYGLIPMDASAKE